MRPVTDTQVLTLQCGGEPLVGILHLPRAARADLGVVIIVGGPQYRVGSHRQFVLTARAFAAAGYPVLRFDVRGMGDSAAPQRTFEDIESDIRCAVDALLGASPGLKGVVLWGLCDAASASLMYCGRDSRVTHLILANPWVRSAAGADEVILRHYYWQRLFQRSFWERVLTFRMNPFSAATELVARVFRARASGKQSDARSAAVSYIERMLQGLQQFRGDVLLLMSGQDLTAQEFVDLSRKDERWAVALARVTRVERPLADHTFSARKELDAVNDSCIDWLGRGQPAAVPAQRKLSA